MQEAFCLVFTKFFLPETAEVFRSIHIFCFCCAAAFFDDAAFYPAQSFHINSHRKPSHRLPVSGILGKHLIIQLLRQCGDSLGPLLGTGLRHFADPLLEKLIVGQLALTGHRRVELHQIDSVLLHQRPSLLILRKLYLASSDEAAVLSLHEVEACQTLLEVSLCSRPHHTVPRHGDQKIDAESGSVTGRFLQEACHGISQLPYDIVVVHRNHQNLKGLLLALVIDMDVLGHSLCQKAFAIADLL